MNIGCVNHDCQQCKDAIKIELKTLKDVICCLESYLEYPEKELREELSRFCKKMTEAIIYTEQNET